jgi:hypothetical protein
MVLKEIIQDMICHAILLPRTRARLSTHKTFEIVIAYARSVGFADKISKAAIARFLNEHFTSVKNNGKRFYLCVPNPAHWQEDEPLRHKDLYFIKGAKKWN